MRAFTCALTEDNGMAIVVDDRGRFVQQSRGRLGPNVRLRSAVDFVQRWDLNEIVEFLTVGLLGSALTQR
jgi:hypothetical protein